MNSNAAAATFSGRTFDKARRAVLVNRTVYPFLTGYALLTSSPHGLPRRWKAAPLACSTSLDRPALAPATGSCSHVHNPAHSRGRDLYLYRYDWEIPYGTVAETAENSKDGSAYERFVSEWRQVAGD